VLVIMWFLDHSRATKLIIVINTFFSLSISESIIYLRKTP
jgi:hypothetical protein